MHDIKFIRENPEAFDAGLARRGLGPMSGAILAKDAETRAAKQRFEELKAEANTANAAIGAAAKAGRQDEVATLKAKGAAFKEQLPALESAAAALAGEVDEMLATLPNLPAAEVPEGADEEGNVEQKRWGDPRDFDFSPRDHVDIGGALGLDFETAQKVSGARFAYLRGKVARLNRALGQFMLDSHTQNFGYWEVSTPVLVRSEAMFGTTQLPKFAEDSFQTTDGRWLISTSEISLTNQVRESILSEAELPLRFTALTPCFRSEAGAAGKDTRGLIRQHQFDKVELVSITTPEMSRDEHERMTSAAEAILEALDLPYRRMLLCAGDMGFAAEKTYDLEVWLPGQGKYREISSCSNCGPFQARRMAARYRPEGEKGTRFVHTLNGSGLAVGRTLVAVLENYQNRDGSVTIPPALVGHMGGIEVIEPAR
ncbi:MAG: serine--tRNA ligase [Proteobacteria bacterium]|nr:serine--tRNA ligase [Pseudomonadota bacterium]